MYIIKYWMRPLFTVDLISPTPAHDYPNGHKDEEIYVKRIVLYF